MAWFMRQLGSLNFWLVLAVDVVLLVAAHVLAYAIRFDFVLGGWEWSSIRTVLPLLLPAKLAIFAFFGLYRGMWRYTGLTDLLNILKACIITGLLALGGILFVYRFEGFSRSVFVIDAVLTFLLVAGFRLGMRLFYQRLQGGGMLGGEESAVTQRRKPLLIIGAGDAAEKITREILDNRALPHKIKGFLDDHSAKIGRRIHGIPVLGAIADLAEYAARTGAREVLIAIPSADRDQMSRIVEICRGAGVPFKTLPG